MIVVIGLIAKDGKQQPVDEPDATQRDLILLLSRSACMIKYRSQSRALKSPSGV